MTPQRGSVSPIRWVPVPAPEIIMQRENEQHRIALDGVRTDDGSPRTVVVLRNLGGGWALYPHGVERLGVFLPSAEAVKMARMILDADG